jgi:hypothetical protein
MGFAATPSNGMLYVFGGIGKNWGEKGAAVV